jgi:DNA-binding CsgD family transcriptional regulator
MACALRLNLSPQQCAIIRLILEEDLTAEAAALRLGVKPRTVRTQMERMYVKLGLHSRAALVKVVGDTLWRLRVEGREKD